MKKIGQILKDARLLKKYSFESLGEITKIKPSFLELLEKEDWDNLPSFPVILGFTKTISSFLELDEKVTVAILKRDYPPKKLNITPKPDISSKKTFGPKLAFILGTSFIVILILGYLVFQYISFISPPKLEIVSPADGQQVNGNSALVFGKTEEDAKITVNNEPVLVGEDGKFSVNIGITEATNEIVIKAISRSGKETVISRRIQTEQ